MSFEAIYAKLQTVDMTVVQVAKLFELACARMPKVGRKARLKCLGVHDPERQYLRRTEKNGRIYAYLACKECDRLKVAARKKEPRTPRPACQCGHTRRAHLLGECYHVDQKTRKSDCDCTGFQEPSHV